MLFLSVSYEPAILKYESIDDAWLDRNRQILDLYPQGANPNRRLAIENAYTFV